MGDQEAAGVYFEVMAGYESYCVQECEVSGAETASVGTDQAGSTL